MKIIIIVVHVQQCNKISREHCNENNNYCRTRATVQQCTRHQAPGTRHQAPGTRHQAPGTRHQAPGTRHQAPGTRHQAPGTRHQAPGTRHQAPGTRHQAPGTRHQAPGTRHQAPGTRHQAPGTRQQYISDIRGALQYMAKSYTLVSTVQRYYYFLYLASFPGFNHRLQYNIR